ncbi:MAG TPA: sterol desaturase family protein [Kofleriaceae bacterium]|jgi:sterol desaturase/sphingolipid hydroxylase (fatty acid hydroxylase superfamily)
MSTFLFLLSLENVRYALAAALGFGALVVWGERWRRRRVRPEPLGRGQIRREVSYSVVTALIFAGVGTATAYGARAGIFHLYVHENSPLYFALTVALLIVLQDAYFYWTHRAMHHRWLFRRMHLVHHLSRNPSPWAAYAFAPAEAFVHAAFVPLVVLVMPVHHVALFVFLTFMIVRNVLGHLGVELFPAGFTRGWLRFSTTTTHHALHHYRVRGNYGLYFTWWDRIAGTTDPTYETTFDALTTTP